MAETAVTVLLCCGFQRTSKMMGQVYQCSWRICREINAFSQVCISHVLRFISMFYLFTDSFSYKIFKTFPILVMKLMAAFFIQTVISGEEIYTS
jgi:hypothetical protein